MSDNTGSAVEEKQVISIDRRIPLPWMLSGLAALVVGLGSLYFQVQQQGQKLTEIAADVKAVKDAQSVQTIKAVEDSYVVKDLVRRLTVLEATIQAGQQIKNEQRR